MRSSLSLHLEFGITVGSLDAASGPAACRFFLRPTRVVGGGGSYFGFSFYSGGEGSVSQRLFKNEEEEVA